MVKIYMRWVRDKKMTLDEVPERWREDVRALLEKADEVSA